MNARENWENEPVVKEIDEWFYKLEARYPVCLFDNFSTKNQADYLFIKFCWHLL